MSASIPRTCRTCEHWSPYLHDLGEYLEYVTRRQEAWARADDIVTFHKAWPHKPADDRRGSETCDRYDMAPEGSA
jgi:hypothetical protein